MDGEIRPTPNLTYPLVIEAAPSSKKRKKDAPKLIVVSAPFDEENERNGSLERKNDRTLLSLPSGENDFAVFEAEDENVQECVLLFDGKRFVLRHVERQVKAKKQIQEEGEIGEIVFDDLADALNDDLVEEPLFSE